VTTPTQNQWLKTNPVNCYRGAPQGCSNDYTPRNTVVRIERLRMVDGCYDLSGTYWGCGSREHGWVYAIWSDRDFEPCLHETRVCIYIRAKSRGEARDHAISLGLVPMRH
jgi:hypothetical protein